MLPDSLVLFLAVVKRKLVKILCLDKVRKTFARMHILVDLHENFLRLSNNSTCQLAVRSSLALLKDCLLLDALR